MSFSRPRRRLGEMLVEDFAVSPDIVKAALAAQSETPALDREFVMHEIDATYRFGEFERNDMARRVRWYAMLLVALVFYTWYPLSLLVQSAPNSSSWSLPIRAYGAMGIALVLFCFFAGDYVVKSFGAFLKVRLRIQKARRLLRWTAVDSGWLPQSAMPVREPRLTGDQPERPDPDYSRFHNWLPLFYTAFSALKLGLLAVFVCLVWCGAIHPGRQQLYHALWTVCALAVVWIFVTGGMCVRYKRTMLEGELVSAQRPFPRVDTERLRELAAASSWKGAYFGWGTIHVLALLGYWLARAADAPWFLVVACTTTVIGLVIRVLDVNWRVSALRAIEAEGPAVAIL